MKTTTVCPYYTNSHCTSCTHLNLPYEQALELKLNSLTQSIAQLSPAITPIIEQPFSPSSIFPSRTKAKLSVGGTTEDPTMGITGQNLAIIELEKCPLHIHPINGIICYLKRIITDFKLTPYDIQTRRGELKTLIITSNHSGSEIILRFVLRSKEALDRIRRASPTIQARFPEIKVIAVNIQPIPHAILEGPEEIYLTNEKIIWETFDTFTLTIGPQSFTQVTYDCANALYHKAASILAASGATTLLDLFCGTGGFSFAAKNYISQGLGVELSENAIECANTAKHTNNANNLTFKACDVEQFLQTFNPTKLDAIIVNPPRRGLSSPIIDQIKRLNPSLVLYSSCNYHTLLRDLKQMAPVYTLTRLIPFDMFPYTDHFEVLAEIKKI